MDCVRFANPLLDCLAEVAAADTRGERRSDLPAVQKRAVGHAAPNIDEELHVTRRDINSRSDGGG
jgi:hypothetical protein